MEKKSKKKTVVFLDVSIDGDPSERLIFELFSDVAPKTAENFRALCTGEKGVSLKTLKPLHYKGTFFHRIIKGHAAQGGDFLRQEGNYGESIYDGKFPDEYPKLKHDGPGLLSMSTADRDERGSLFSVTFKGDHHLDRKNIVFGKLVDGYDLLKKIEDAGSEDGRPAVTVKITNAGEVHGDEKEGSKLKEGKDSIGDNNHELRRKGKHKKSSKRRKKRRIYYISETDSSTDMDSSESDSDSDSYTTSSSDSSSSSEDRHKKRKRSRRSKHRHGKRKDRRRGKQSKKRDRKSKRKSKRKDVSDGESGSSSAEDVTAAGPLDEKHNSGNQSPLVKDHEAAISDPKRGEEKDVSEREEGECPRENGNGVGTELESDRSANRLLDGVNYPPSKSRSPSLSPRRTVSKSMSISPVRSADRSQGIGAKHNRSRSPNDSRSRSNSPAASVSSRSKNGRSVSRSPPVRRPSYRQNRRSVTVSPPPRKRVSESPPRNLSRSPVRSSRKSVSRSPVRPSRSRSSGRALPRRSPSASPVRARNRTNRRSYSKSPVRARSPVSDRGRSSSRSPVDGSPKRIRRGRGFSDRFSYVRRYRSPSPDRSPVRSYRYGARVDRDRYSSYRRSPRRYRSPPRARTPPRYRGRRSRTRSPSKSRSPVRRNRRRSPSRSASPVSERRKSSPSPSTERSPSESPPRKSDKGNSRSPSQSPLQKPALVSYEDGSPDSARN